MIFTKYHHLYYKLERCLLSRGLNVQFAVVLNKCQRENWRDNQQWTIHRQHRIKDTEQRQTNNKTHTFKIISNTNPIENTGVDPMCSSMVGISCLLLFLQQGLTTSLDLGSITCRHVKNKIQYLFVKFWIFCADLFLIFKTFFLFQFSNLKSVCDIYSLDTYIWFMKRKIDWFDLLCLTPLSAIFQLYHGDQF